MRDEIEICLGGLIWFGSALFPIPQRAYRDRVAIGEFFLGQTQRTAERLHPRHAKEPFSPFWRNRRIFGVGCSGGLDLNFTLWCDWIQRNEFFPAILVHAHEGAISAESDCSSPIAHL